MDHKKPLEDRSGPGWSRLIGLSALGKSASSTEDHTLTRSLLIDRIHRYGWAVDERDTEGVADCFTEHAIWEGWQRGHTHVEPRTGRTAITEHMRSLWASRSEQRRHIFTNEVIDVIGGAQARAHAYLVLLSSTVESTALVSTGPYRFDLEREIDHVWRISHLVGGWDTPFDRNARSER